MSMAINDVLRHIRNTDGCWGTSKFDPNQLAKRVLAINFCAHSNPGNQGADGQPPTNHWSLFLEVPNSTAVRIDVVPSDPGELGMVMVETKNYVLSENAVYCVDSPIREGITVSMIFNLIINLGRDRYIFSPVGEGCRYWLSVLAQDMYMAGIIPEESVQRVCSALSKYWRCPRNTGYVERALVAGVFSSGS